jgi:hypothetical protein
LLKPREPARTRLYETAVYEADDLLCIEAQLATRIQTGSEDLAHLRLPLATLNTIQGVAEAFATRLLTYKLHDLGGHNSRLGLALVKFASVYESAGYHLENLPQSALTEIGETFQTSCVLCRSGERTQSTQSLPAELANALIALAESKLLGSNDVVVSDCLSELDPIFVAWSHQAAGMMLLSLDRDRQGFLAFIRPELLHTRQWGGDPTSSLRDAYQHLSPRNSFATSIEQVRGRCEPWTLEQQQLAGELHSDP